MPFPRAALCAALVLLCSGAVAQPTSSRPPKGVPKPAPASVLSKDLFEVLDNVTQQDARSVVAFLCANRLSPKADGTYEVSTIPLQPPPTNPPQNVCVDQPFRTQAVAAFCSGVLVTTNRVATSANCLAQAKKICGGDFAGSGSAVRAVFGFAMKDASSPPRFLPSADVFVPQRIVKQTTGLAANWALVELNRSTDKRAVPLRLEKSAGGTLRVIGHPQGLPAKVSQPQLTDNSASLTFTVSSSTVGQWPGTPVFNGDSPAIVGLVVDDPVSWSCSPSNACCHTAPIPGRGTTTTVVRSNTIASALCSPNMTLCGTECVNTTSDANHCGRCDTTCTLPNATASCQAGGCRIATCAPGFADCDRVASNGCETPLNTSSNCGACGAVCNLPHADELCTAGTCQVQTCEPGYANCDGSPVNGCETKLGTTANCSACGAACNLANAAEACVDGACQVLTCEPGYANCDGSPSTGCEVHLGTLTDCASCGDACNLDHASETCSAGKCKVLSCEPGYADCDHVAANGCETPLGTTTNCGACGQACDLAHSSESCVAGSCQVLTCEPGYANCDNSPANGCETPLGTTANCGACGVSCETQPNTIPYCTNGSCQYACKAGYSDCDGLPGCEKAGACGPSCSAALCDDNNACTTDFCDSAGQCAHSTMSCSDGNECTTDSCNPATGCTFTAVAPGTLCRTDDNKCTNDVCSTNGQCSHPPLSCDDGNSCTADSCDPVSGCINKAVQPGSSCATDGDECTDDICNSAGVCTHAAKTCDDHNECTENKCIPSSGCSFQPLSPSASCASDGDACTSDFCDGHGACTHLGINCDDSNECTTDSCIPTSGCDHKPRTGAACASDGKACTTDVCDGTGMCTHPDISCNDGNECTDDTCNPNTGVCAHNNRGFGSACSSDDLACTLDICNGFGTCTHYSGCSGNETCNGSGFCQCSPPYTSCGDVCTDTQWDKYHCGSCNRDCTAIYAADPSQITCTNGVCGCGTGSVTNGPLKLECPMN